MKLIQFVKKKSLEWKKVHEKVKDEKNSGFTFVETLAVLAIMALLTAGAGVSTIQIVDQARRTEAKEEIASFKSALQSYYVDCGSFPTAAQGLEALWSKPVLVPVSENWNGPYLDRQVQRDPWGNEYVYLQRESSIMPEEAPQGLPFVLISYGGDGVPGGNGRNMDINSWD